MQLCFSQTSRKELRITLFLGLRISTTAVVYMIVHDAECHISLETRVTLIMSNERYLPMTLPNKLAHLAEEAGEVVAAVGKTSVSAWIAKVLNYLREFTKKTEFGREIEDLKKAIAKVEQFL
jgi:hypothetical protein